MGGSGAKKTYYGISANGELAVYVYVVYVSREFKESYTGPYKAYCPSLIETRNLSRKNRVTSKFNDASFETGIVPDSFKLAIVIPVYEKGISFSVSVLKIEL